MKAVPSIPQTTLKNGSSVPKTVAVQVFDKLKYINEKYPCALQQLYLLAVHQKITDHLKIEPLLKCGLVVSKMNLDQPFKISSSHNLQVILNALVLDANNKISVSPPFLEENDDTLVIDEDADLWKGDANTAHMFDALMNAIVCNKSNWVLKE